MAVIPAGTGIKYKLPNSTENHKVEDEFEKAAASRGIDIPILGGVPGVDTDAGNDEARKTLEDLSLKEEEVF